MPTAAKLFAAATLAILGYIAANAYTAYLPEGMSAGLLREFTALIGALVGWFSIGKLFGKGYSDAIGTGLIGVVTQVFFTLLLCAIYLMIQKSMKMMYDGPMDAVLGVFELMLEYGTLMVKPDVLGILAIGGVLVGVIAEWAGRRWS